MSFRFVQKIGSGGFGVVDEVVDGEGGRFARKTFQLNQGSSFPTELIPNAKKRFIREARLQAGIRHQHIVPVLALGVEEDPPFFTMPLAASSLEKDIRADKSLNGKFLTAILDIMSGLEEIHLLGIFHRDLKPANVLRLSKTEGPTANPFYAIGDFGLMSYHNTQLSSLTTTGMALGSDFYTAPEITQQLKNASPQSDIYSLGCIIHDIVGHEPRVPCAEIHDPCAWGSILLNCTRKTPGRRFTSVAAVRDAILSMEAVAIPASAGAAAMVAIIGLPRPLSREEWQQISDFVDSKPFNSSDAHVVLMNLSIARLNELMAAYPEIARQIGLSYAAWVRDTSFIFNDCDGVANRLKTIMGLVDLNIQAECIMATLRMGTRHNRWYVEREFLAMVGPSMGEPLARRIAVEFRADSKSTCDSIRNLEQSISVSRSAMHPLLVQTLAEICP